MTQDEIREYIRSKNLGIQTVEQCISFLDDSKFCREDWYTKKEIIEAVHGAAFPAMWRLISKALNERYRRMRGQIGRRGDEDR